MESQNINNNVNNNRVTVHVEHPKTVEAPKKAEPNWYVKTILGGIIALALSVGGYYLKKNMDGKAKASVSVDQHAERINPNN